MKSHEWLLKLSEILRIEAEKLDKLTLTELIAKYEALEPERYEFEIIDYNRYKIRDRKRIAGYLYASDLGNYGWCLRQLWLRQKYGLIYTEAQFRAVLRGQIVHKLMEDKINGLHEIEFKDWNQGLIGHIDWLILHPRVIWLIDFKTSMKCGFYTYLQMQAYLHLVRRILNMENVKAIVIYRYGYKIYRAEIDINFYITKLREILAKELPPPKLPKKLQHRCKSCGYKGREYCDKYEKSAFSIEKLMEKYWIHGEYCKNQQAIEI